MYDFLNDEIKLCADFIEEVDIAKFIIQAYTGPFHMLKEKPDLKYIGERIKNDFLANHTLIKNNEIFQQISERCSRVHITPFLRKYKSARFLAELFLQNYDFFSKDFLPPIPEEYINTTLAKIQNYNIDIIKNLLNQFNQSGFVPHHSQKYKENLHPSYLIFLNDVIKQNIKLL